MVRSKKDKASPPVLHIPDGPLSEAPVRPFSIFKEGTSQCYTQFELRQLKVYEFHWAKQTMPIGADLCNTMSTIKEYYESLCDELAKYQTRESFKVSEQPSGSKTPSNAKKAGNKRSKTESTSSSVDYDAEFPPIGVDKTAHEMDVEPTPSTATATNAAANTSATAPTTTAAASATAPTDTAAVSKSEAEFVSPPAGIEHSPHLDAKIPAKQPDSALNSVRKPNPISVVGITDPLKFTATIDSLAEINYQIKVTRELLKILPETTEDKAKMIDLLKANKIPHFISVDRTPVQKFIIRGLYSNFPLEEITSKFQALGHDVTDVSQLKSRRDGRLLPLYLLQLTRSKTSKEALKVTNICRLRIHVEPFRPSKKATQCFKCQHFFHVAANCNMTPRCVVCGEDHESFSCPIKKANGEPKSEAKCCNCGKSHPASYKGCENFPLRPQFRKPYSEALKAKSKIIPPSKISKPTQPPKQLVTEELYSLEELSSTLPSLLEVIAQLKAELQTDSLADLLQRFQQVLKTVQSQKASLSKAIAFTEAMPRFFANTPSEGATTSGSG